MTAADGSDHASQLRYDPRLTLRFNTQFVLPQGVSSYMQLFAICSRAEPWRHCGFYAQVRVFTPVASLYTALSTAVPRANLLVNVRDLDLINSENAEKRVSHQACSPGYAGQMKSGPPQPYTDTAPKAEKPDPRWELVQRVSSSSTLEKSHRLRTFLQYVCRCALEGHPETATEQQIGIHVFGRPPGYNPNEDNIVRAQARLLRMKLEYYFSNEAKNEPMVITIPKGQYVPVFNQREIVPVPPLPAAEPPLSWRRIAVYASILLLVGLAVLLVLHFVRSGTSGGTIELPGSTIATSAHNKAATQSFGPTAIDGPPGEIRIAAGSTEPYVDVRGRRWEADRYYTGGIASSEPGAMLSLVSDPGLFKTFREAVSSDTEAKASERRFSYDIPVPPGVYELRLYFADPQQRSIAPGFEDAQNRRRFNIDLNGQPLLKSFDAVADGINAPVDIRSFKDVTPAADGKVHLVFSPSYHRPFISGIELTPGTAGKMKPLRIITHRSDFVDDDGTRWSADTFFLGGRHLAYMNLEKGPKLSPLYLEERYGNFSYEIPVPPGTYTLTLYFAETYFVTSTSSAICHGVGCRTFDVTCNGVSLLRDLDVYQSAGGAFRPVVRSFHGLKPNGQGKLLISFDSKIDYAEVRAIEIVDEAK
jgi:hypothetical protein